MSVRRFGPILGAGVQVVEKAGDQAILPAPLGVTVMVGEFERGTVAEPAFLAGVLDFRRRNGGRILTGSAPVAAEDFYKMGRGAGQLITYRVTEGDEVQSEITLFTREGTAAAPASGRKVLGTLKALSGGKHGGQRATYIDEHTGVGDLTDNTLDTGDTMVTNEWAGGTLELKKVTSKTYPILSNTAAGVITVQATDLDGDWTAGSGTPANRYVLTKANVDHLGNDKHLAVLIGDGDENPTTEFSLEIYVDGELVLSYRNLNTDPTKANYWVNVINDDPSNYEIVATDSYSGDKTLPAVRPANGLGQSSALAATLLTIDDPDVTVNSPVAGADPTVAITLNATSVPQVLTGTVGNAGADITWTTTAGPLSVVSVGFSGTPEDLGDEIGTVTVTNGGTALVDGDTVVIDLRQLMIPDELIGGKVWPDVVNEPDLWFVITDNTNTTVSVMTGQDLTNGAAIAAGAVYQLQYQQEFAGGHDSAPVTDAQYQAAFAAVTSTLNKLFGKNLGLVKLASPGVTSTTVTKAGIEYAAAKNYSYVVEIPSSYLTESAAINHINTTIGRSEYARVHFPSYGKVPDPDATPGTTNVPLVTQTLTGMILGREALVARQYDGYHKAAAGIDVTLPDVLELPTGNPDTATELNEELLNPQGINVVKFRQGTAIMWGDRTISPTAEWKWKHQREQLSHYEQLLRENFDWIIFAVNDTEARIRVQTALIAYFLPEWTKAAIRGDTFMGDAFQLKIDDDNNTDATMAAGDLNAEITLRLADTVERFRIVIGKAGIFDAVQ